MPEPYSRQSPENKYDRQRSPSFVNNDRYTPVAVENPRTQRPEVFYIQTKHDNKSIDDQPSYEPSSSPPINTFYPSSNARPEFYHMKKVDNDNENIVYDRRSSPALMNNNRVSPAPYHKPDGQGIEMYHIKGGDNINRQSPPPPPIHDNHQTPLFNNSTNFHDDHDPHKITTYLLTTTDGENRPPSSHIQRRTPSPPVNKINYSNFYILFI